MTERPHEEPFDLLLRGGEVIDGTGAPRFRADVGVRRGRIAAVGDLSQARARQAVEIPGLVVAPGFIDIHSHSDLSLLEDGRAESKVRQGVTTEVVGNCSMSPAPVTEEVREEVRQAFSYMAGQVEWTWRSMAEYLARLEEQGIAINVAALVGHGTLRAAVRGFARGFATRQERERMKALLERCLEEGAVGLSTGFIYAPSCYADEEEVHELGRVVERYGGLYATHMRGEGASLLTSVEEALRMAQASGARTQISHLKAAGRPNWGKVRPAVELIERAREQGYDVAFDLYPYTAGSTFLGALTPPWAQEGGPSAMLARFADPSLRPRLKRAMEEGDEGWPSFPGARSFLPENIFISSVGSEEGQRWVGRSLAEVAALRGQEPWEAFFDLLVEEKGQVTGVVHLMSEEDVRFLLTIPYGAIGSDGLAIAPKGHWLKSRPHPRFYGTFPRVLGFYARQEGILPLEEAVRRMTSLPASRLGWKDRGRIREGAAADLVVFDPQRVQDTATFEEPHRFPTGIEFVFVNGEMVLRSGEHTDARPGQVLRRAT